MESLDEFEKKLSSLMLKAGCSSYRISDLIHDTQQCRDEIYQDEATHGQSNTAPFFNFIIADGTAIFTIFDSEFSVYVFHCNEEQLINDAAPLAMSDICDCKSLLSVKYGKEKPDLTISRSLAEYWLS